MALFFCAGSSSALICENACQQSKNSQVESLKLESSASQKPCHSKGERGKPTPLPKDSKCPTCECTFSSNRVTLKNSQFIEGSGFEQVLIQEKILVTKLIIQKPHQVLSYLYTHFFSKIRLHLRLQKLLN